MMCDWGTQIVLEVPIPANCSYTGKFRWDKKPIDSCILHFVEALNRSGIYTGGSCCGHGKGNGYISLHNGTVLVVEWHRPGKTNIIEAILGDEDDNQSS